MATGQIGLNGQHAVLLAAMVYGQEHERAPTHRRPTTELHVLEIARRSVHAI